jgi:TP901 family phage tail tape measure protein
VAFNKAALKIDILLSASTTRLERGFARGRQATKTFSQGLLSSSQHAVTFQAKLGQAARSLVGFGSAAAGAYAAVRLIRAAVTEANEFNRAMAQSTAIMGDLSQQTEAAMRATARQAAYGSKFDPTETAKGYFYLASAGFNAEQSMAALGQVTAFAQAGMFDLARATDLATDAQSALGLTVKNAERNQRNLTRVTDVLVKANTLANASVEQFSLALTSKAGAAARMLGKDVEEVTAVLAAMADQGTKAEEAGTALSRILVGMRVNALQNASAFERHRIAVYDSQGEVRNLADVIGDMERSLGKLSDAGKTAAIMELGFTKKTADAAAMLLGASEKIRGYEAALRDASGITREVAEKNMPEFDKMISKITVGLKTLTQVGVGGWLEETGEAFNDIIRPIESITTELAAAQVQLDRFGSGMAAMKPPKWLGEVWDVVAPAMQNPLDTTGFLQSLGRLFEKAEENRAAQRKAGEASERMGAGMRAAEEAAAGLSDELERVTEDSKDIFQTLQADLGSFDPFASISPAMDALEKAEASLQDQVATFGMDAMEKQRWRLEQMGFLDPVLQNVDALQGKLRGLQDDKALKDFAKSVEMDVKTPLEQAQEQVDRIGEAVNRGFLDADIAMQAIERLQKGLDDALETKRELATPLDWGGAMQGTADAFRRQVETFYSGLSDRLRPKPPTAPQLNIPTAVQFAQAFSPPASPQPLGTGASGTLPAPPRYGALQTVADTQTHQQLAELIQATREQVGILRRVERNQPAGPPRGP